MRHLSALIGLPGSGNWPAIETIAEKERRLFAESEVIRRTLHREEGRVRVLGDWPAWIAEGCLLERVPGPEGKASGFDAGIACALGLIPAEAQRLSARLHAAYTPEAVAQVRSEAEALRPDSETTWWAAACSICREEGVSSEEFVSQINAFQGLAADPARRLSAARAELAAMRGRFEVRDGLAIATADGGMQGAYIAGHDLAGMHATEADLYFLGTFRPSLGLEDFSWSQPADPSSEDPELRRGRSGPVHGSLQFVKCSDAGEFAAASEIARRYLSMIDSSPGRSGRSGSPRPLSDAAGSVP